MSQPAGAADAAALRAQFDAEVRTAGLALADDDRERLYATWADHLPVRSQLRSVAIDPAEEPSLIEKPALPGGGITLGTATGGSA